MTMAEDFETSKKAYQFLAGHVDEWQKDQEKANRGRDHTVNQHSAEISDLWKAIEGIQKALGDFGAKEHALNDTVVKIAAYLKKKFPEDFGDQK